MPPAAPAPYKVRFAFLRHPRERDARDLWRLRQVDSHGDRICDCKGSNGVTRAAKCMHCGGSSVCTHLRQIWQCKECQDLLHPGKPLAKNKRCPTCLTRRADNCKARGCPNAK